MTVEDDREADRLLRRALELRDAALSAEIHAREATVRFLDAARIAGRTYERIGVDLGITATAAREYHKRNRRRIRGGADV